MECERELTLWLHPHWVPLKNEKRDSLQTVQTNSIKIYFWVTRKLINKLSRHHAGLYVLFKSKTVDIDTFISKRGLR